MAGWDLLFGNFEDRLWLNPAGHGPMPLREARAVGHEKDCKVFRGREMVERYQGVQSQLRRSLGLLISATTGHFILGNSASYGLSMIARALTWPTGRNEVLLVKGDFPANLAPWRGLSHPVKTRFIPSEPWARDPYAA